MPIAASVRLSTAPSDWILDSLRGPYNSGLLGGVVFTCRSVNLLGVQLCQNNVFVQMIPIPQLWMLEFLLI